MQEATKPDCNVAAAPGTGSGGSSGASKGSYAGINKDMADDGDGSEQSQVDTPPSKEEKAKEDAKKAAKVITAIVISGAGCIASIALLAGRAFKRSASLPADRQQVGDTAVVFSFRYVLIQSTPSYHSS